MSDRKLARVVQIDSLHPIEGADRIELALIGGWQVVVGKGLYSEGDKCVYFEVDSLLPTTVSAFSELANRLSSKLLHEIDGKPYARIKTAKMMKHLSQGFCVPLSHLMLNPDSPVGSDVTKWCGVLKYEKGEERSMNNAGTSDGVKSRTTKPFPSFIPKTDQNRVQNIVPRYLQSVADCELFEKTFKLNGSSMTVWLKDSVLGVASRNVSFRMQVENKGFMRSFRDYVKQVKKHGFRHAKFVTQLEPDNNAFTQMAKNSGVTDALVRLNRNLAIQGEMVGPTIQKNFEGVKSNQFYIYDIFDIDRQKYLLPVERVELIAKYNLQAVPPAGIVTLPATVAEAIEDADGPSGLNGKMREGFVYKAVTRDFSFKVISNKYLMKEE